MHMMLLELLLIFWQPMACVNAVLQPTKV